MDIWVVVRTILEKNPGIRAKELIPKLRERTGLARSTIYSHLRTFDIRGKLCREKGYYLPFQFEIYTKMRLPVGEKIFASKADYEAALKHSKDLVLGLEAILAEDPRWFPQEAGWAFQVRTEGIGLKQFAEEHLRKSYRSIYQKVEAYREMKEKYKLILMQKGYSEGVINFVLYGTQSIPQMREQPWSRSEKPPKELEEIMDQRFSAYVEVRREIRLLEHKVGNGEPLDGSCQLCPKVRIL